MTDNYIQQKILLPNMYSEWNISKADPSETTEEHKQARGCKRSNTSCPSHISDRRLHLVDDSSSLQRHGNNLNV